MQKAKKNRNDAGNRSVAGSQPEPFDPYEMGKSNNGEQQQGRISGNAQNKSERRFKDWRTSETALPL